ncbi:MAG: class I SAM-dependent methyltransferase [Deltaproteobacteria bacterium]|nr:class I SAM-dependent methyltransferase [Deltaproteobacteria bacterium]
MTDELFERGHAMDVPMRRGRLLATAYAHIYQPTADLRLVRHCLTRVRGAHLALGCGTGRELEPALEARRAAIGIDYWEDMLDVARRRFLARHADLLSLQCADFTSVELPRQVGLITCLSNTWPMILERKHRRAMWQRCCSSLATGGLMMVVVVNQYPPGVLERHMEIDTDSGKLDFHIRWEEDRAMSLRTYHLDLSRQQESEVHTIPTAIIAHTEMIIDAQNAGFLVDAIFGDYDESPLSDSSPWQVIICTKDA